MRISGREKALLPKKKKHTHTHTRALSLSRSFSMTIVFLQLLQSEHWRGHSPRVKLGRAVAPLVGVVGSAAGRAHALGHALRRLRLDLLLGFG